MVDGSASSAALAITASDNALKIEPTIYRGVTSLNGKFTKLSQ